LHAHYEAKEAFVARCAELLLETEGITVAESAALEVVHAMRKGGLAPVPRDPQACVHCDARGACRKPRFAVEPEEIDETS
jgi:hypothetical protein